MDLELVELPADFDRSRLIELFRMADDSERAIAGYLNEGRVFGLHDAGRIVGHAQVVARDEGEVEVRSLAIVPALQRQGHGRAMLGGLLVALAREGVRRVWVATASADIANLAFYQKLGFRMASIERDVFSPERGYPADLQVDGIRVWDRVWFDRELRDEGA
jgi:ribosomal protein S18 acetylase RimI-like enzyme